MRALHQGCIMQLRHHYAVDDYCLHIRIVRPVKCMSREQRKSTCIVCTIVGHGYNDQQKYTICDACRPCHVLNSKHTEASFSPNSTDLLRAHWISNTDTSYCRHSLKIIDFLKISCSLLMLLNWCCCLYLALLSNVSGTFQQLKKQQ